MWQQKRNLCPKNFLQFETFKNGTFMNTCVNAIKLTHILKVSPNAVKRHRIPTMSTVSTGSWFMVTFV